MTKSLRVRMVDRETIAKAMKSRPLRIRRMSTRFGLLAFQAKIKRRNHECATNAIRPE